MRISFNKLLMICKRFCSSELFGKNSFFTEGQHRIKYGTDLDGLKKRSLHQMNNRHSKFVLSIGKQPKHINAD